MRSVDQLIKDASNPTTGADALEAIWSQVGRLGHGDRPRVIEALVRNPNLALQRFQRLAGTQPLAALENPAFDLYALEDPGWFARLSSAAATAMVLAEQGRHRVVDLAMLHPTPAPRRFAACLDLFDMAQLDRLVRGPTRWTQWASTLISKLEKDVLRTPGLRGLAVELLDSQQFVSAAWVPRAWVDAALEHERGEHLSAAVATRQDLGLARQRRLAGNVSRTVRWRLAGNPTIAPEIAERLSRDDWPAVRQALARNRTTPDAVLHRLLADPQADVVTAAIATLTSRRVPADAARR